VATVVTIGYGDEAGYRDTPAVRRDAAHAHDRDLVEGGALVGMAGAPFQVRNHGEGGVRTEPGAYLRADLPLAGFAVIEAASAEEAADLVAGTPCAVAGGVVEVWPLLEPPAAGDSPGTGPGDPDRATG
jgi:hypothetical protein